MIKKQKILIFSDWFYPGFKAGGPITSIKNLVEHLGEKLEFYVFTSDRDLGEKESYSNVELNKWIEVQGGSVYYCSPQNYSQKCLNSEIENISPDVIYINGVFSSQYSIQPLFVSRKYKRIKTIVAPRGMFNEGALKLKGLKKQLFLKLAKLIGLYRNVTWHSTSNSETYRIKQVISSEAVVFEVKNLISKMVGFNEVKPFKERLKFVSVGRVSPVKNTLFLLEILKEVKVSGKQISIDFIGLIEDEIYYKECLAVVAEIENIEVNFIGDISPFELQEKWKEYDLFLSPTLNENFGHAIVEAISHHLIVMLSDQTPWNGINEYNCGWALPLEPKIWISTLERYLNLELEAVVGMRHASAEFLEKEIDVELDKKMYLELFS